MLARHTSCTVQCSRQMLIEDFICEGTFSRTGYTSNTGHDAKRNVHINIFQVILPCTFYRKKSRRFPAFLRYRNFDASTEVCTSNGFLAFHNICGCTCCHNFSTMYARCRSDIHNIISSPHGVFIMFNNNQCISQIFQIHQRPQKLIIVSLMQTDTRLVKNIGNTHQSGTDLGCQTNSLRFSTG